MRYCAETRANDRQPDRERGAVPVEIGLVHQSSWHAGRRAQRRQFRSPQLRPPDLLRLARLKITRQHPWKTCGPLLAALDVHPRVARRILRHSKIAITREIYTMVPDKATLAALKRLSDALSAPDAALPEDAE